jgi:hypothetical protein
LNVIWNTNLEKSSDREWQIKSNWEFELSLFRDFIRTRCYRDLTSIERTYLEVVFSQGISLINYASLSLSYFKTIVVKGSRFECRNWTCGRRVFESTISSCNGQRRACTNSSRESRNSEDICDCGNVVLFLRAVDGHYTVQIEMIFILATDIVVYSASVSDTFKVRRNPKGFGK